MARVRFLLSIFNAVAYIIETTLHGIACTLLMLLTFDIKCYVQHALFDILVNHYTVIVTK